MLKKHSLIALPLVSLAAIAATTSCAIIGMTATQTNAVAPTLKSFKFSATDTSEFDYDFYEETKTASIAAYHGTEESVSIPSSVWHDGVEYTIDTVERDSFKANTTIKSVELADTIKVIGADAFRNCTNLEYISLDANLEIIYRAAFAGCSSMHDEDDTSKDWQWPTYSFQYRGSVGDWAHVGRQQYWHRDALATNILCTDDVCDLDLEVAPISDFDYEIMPEDDEDANNLHSDVDNSLIKLSHNVFIKHYKGNAECVVVPETFYIGSELYTVVEIGYDEYLYDFAEMLVELAGRPFDFSEAFCNNTTVRYIYLPDSIKNIGTKTFAGCTALKRVSFSPLTACEIRNQYFDRRPGFYNDWLFNAFSGCTSLNSRSSYTSMPGIEFRGTVEQFESAHFLDVDTYGLPDTYGIYDDITGVTQSQILCSDGIVTF